MSVPILGSEVWKNQLRATFIVYQGTSIIHDVLGSPGTLTFIHHHHPILHGSLNTKNVYTVNAPREEVYWFLKNFHQVQLSMDLQQRYQCPPHMLIAAETCLELMNIPYPSLSPHNFFMFSPYEIYFAAQVQAPPIQLASNWVDVLLPLTMPGGLKGVNHDWLYSSLMGLPSNWLAKIWLKLPDYFDVLEIQNNERWESLHQRAKEGINDAV